MVLFHLYQASLSVNYSFGHIPILSHSLPSTIRESCQHSMKQRPICWKLIAYMLFSFPSNSEELHALPLIIILSL